MKKQKAKPKPAPNKIKKIILPSNLRFAPKDVKIKPKVLNYEIPKDANKNISIIIPHSNRFDNLFVCLDSLAKQTLKPAVVIISDFSQDTSRAKDIPKRYSGSLNIKFVHFNNKQFVRGPAINAARPFVKTPLMFILDADITFKPTGIKSVLKSFGPPPFKKYLLSFRGYKFNKGGKRGPNHATFDKVYGAFQVYRTHDFDAIGGHNPFMIGWGWQDDDIRNRLILAGCKQIILKEAYDHLYHSPSDNQRTCNKNQEISKRSIFDGWRWRKW